MPEPLTLYSAALLAHARAPRNTAPLLSPTHMAQMDNPLCGDRVRLMLSLSDARIVGASHQTRGCALCIASTSVMTDRLSGASLAEAAEAYAAFRHALEDCRTPLARQVLGIFAGISAAPARTGCVVLPWQALATALGDLPEWTVNRS